MTPFQNTEVAAVFNGFPNSARKGLLHLRELVFLSAASDPEIASISEELRWGQPAYLCKTGSSLRLGIPKTGGFALYVHCQTTLIRDFTELFPFGFSIEGNRAVHFQSVSGIDDEKITFLINAALRYRL